MSPDRQPSTSEHRSDDSSRPRIAVDLRALVPQATGIGVYTRSCLLELARIGDFHLVGTSHRPVRKAEELIAAGVEIEPPSPAPLGVMWQQITLPRRLKRGDFDLLWSPLQTLPVRSPVPGVVTVHDLTVLSMPEAHRWKVRWSQVPFLRKSLEQARTVVSVSESTARDLRKYYPQCSDRIRVIHPGVDPEFRPASAEAIAATRASLNCPNGYLLYAGTLEPRKNVGAVLDAWHNLAASDPKAPPLVLVGGYGWRSRRLERRIQTLAARHPERFHPLGRVDRPRLVEVIQAASVLLYPSFYEGFGLPVAEAMACRVPVIASDRSSLPEVVGDAGIMVPADDPAALANAARSIVRDPVEADELAERGLERSKRFRWQSTARGLNEVFHDGLSEP